jgi:hypothetical protein
MEKKKKHLKKLDAILQHVSNSNSGGQVAEGGELLARD